MEKRLVFDYVNYFSDINFGSCAYAHHLPGWGTLSAGMRYVDYGSFQETNEQGDVVGSFRASDMAFQLGTARAIDSNFTAGVNARFIYSSLAGYTSSGVAADLAVTYRKPQGRFAAALLLRNVGVQVNPYVDQTREKLPYEVQIAISQKLEHLPFRYIVHFTQLQKLDLNYENSNNPTLLVDPLTGESIEPRKMIGDKIMRHVVLGGELSPSQNFHIRFGYNYRRRQELKVDSRAGTVGFSWGFGLKISKFQLNYGRATYHLAGASNHFSVSTRISDFIKKEEN